MSKISRIIFLSILLSFSISLSRGEVIITDNETGTPLAKASIFDKNGVFIAVTEEGGKIPLDISAKSYPLNVRYVGYVPAEISNPDMGVVKLKESTYNLPEVTVDDVSRNNLYIKAYERNYQSGIDANDTINYFTERIIDFVIPLKKHSGHKGWQTGRVLAERQYAHIKQKRKDKSRDSLIYRENKYNKSYGFEIQDEFIIPEEITNGDSLKVTINGKYYPKDVWTKIGDNYLLIRDRLADKKDHLESPLALKLLGMTSEITRRENVYNFSSESKGRISPDMINEASYFDDITLKGKVWQWASEQKEPIPLNSYGELYVVERAYLTADEVKELKKNQPEIKTDFKAPEGIPAPPEKLIILKEEVKKQYPEAN